MSDNSTPALRFKMDYESELTLCKQAGRARRKNRKIQRTLRAVVVFLMWFAMLFFLMRDATGNLRLIAAAIGAFLLTIPVLHFYATNFREVQVTQNLQEQHTSEFMDIELRSDLFFARIGELAGGFGWAHVKQILQDDLSIIVLLNTGGFIYIPRSAFDSTEQQQQFLDDLRRICANGGGPEGLAVHLDCPKCSYDLFGALDDCPECGNKVPAAW